MIKLLGTVALLGYAGYQLLKKVESELEQAYKKDENLSKDEQRESVLKEAKEVQKEVSRLHEIYVTAAKLTEAGKMEELDIKIDGISLAKKLQDEELKLVYLSKILKELK